MKTIRLARPGDVDALLAIYAPYLSTTVTFEYVVPSREEFARRIADVQARFPYLVLEEDGQPIGYAYAHLLAERIAYQWSAELSIYLSPAATGKGTGRPLYLALMELLRTSRISSPVDTGFCHPHPTASMVDARYAVTEEERQAILAACFDEAGALRQWPAREKRKLVVLSAIAEQFKPGGQYTEKEVNRLLGRIYEDFPYLRRLLIEYGFLERTASGSAYWRKE